MNTRRTRIVNFRVTEEEYERLRSASDALGGGGISGYARQATLHLAASKERIEGIRQSSSSEYVFACLSELKRRIAELEIQIGRLNDSKAFQRTHV